MISTIIMISSVRRWDRTHLARLGKLLVHVGLSHADLTRADRRNTFRFAVFIADCNTKSTGRKNVRQVVVTRKQAFGRSPSQCS